MPEVRVQDEQGNIHVFPDGSTPDMIAKAMNVNPPAQADTAVGDQGQMLKSQLPTAAGVWQGVKDTADDLYTGGVKQFGQGIATISSGLNKLPWIGETLAPKVGVQSFKQQMQPDNTTQKIGGGLEQAGEMALTGGPIKAGAETLATKLPFLGRAAAPLMRIVGEGVNAGSNAALHGEPVAPAAMSGAGGGALAESLPFVAPMLKRSAEKQYGKFLNPTKETTKNMTGNIVPELLNRKVVASSGEALENRAADEVAKAGQNISQAVAAHQGPDIQTQPILDALEKYKQGFMVNGTAVNESAVSNAERLQDTVRALGPNVSFQSLNKARQILDANVARAGAYYGKTLSEGSALDAEKAAANAMRRELARTNPDIAKLNGEYHFWSQVQDVMGATNARRVGQQGPLARIFYPAIGAGAGLVHSGAGGAAEGAAALAIANEVIHHPLFRTSSAIFKNELANQLAKGNAAGVAKLLGRLGATLPQGTPQQNTAAAGQPSQ